MKRIALLLLLLPVLAYGQNPRLTSSEDTAAVFPVVPLKWYWNVGKGLVFPNGGIQTTASDSAYLAAQLTLKAPTASPVFTGTVTIPSPFTLGATSVTASGTELNYVDGVTSDIQPQLDAKQSILLTRTGGTLIPATSTDTIQANYFRGNNQFFAPDGSVSASTYSFTAETNSGLYRAGAGDVRFAMGGADVARFLTGGSFGVTGNQGISWGSSGVTSPDVFLARDAANALALRNGTNPQTLRLYNTYTDASNYERFSVGWSTNILRITTFGTGTGSNNREIELRTGGGGNLFLGTNGTNRWAIGATTGHFLAETDNTYDIGASGASRPRSIYAGTQFLGANGSVSAPSYSFANFPNYGFYHDGSSEIVAAINGVNKFSIGTNSVNVFTSFSIWSNPLSFINIGGEIRSGGTTNNKYIRFRVNSSGTDAELDSTAFTLRSDFPLAWSATTNAQSGTPDAFLRRVDVGIVGTDGSFSLGESNSMFWTGRSRIFSDEDGTITLTNNATGDFNLLRLGGATSSYPALERNATGLDVRLADDSDYAPFGTGTLTVNTAGGNVSWGTYTPTATDSANVGTILLTSDAQYSRIGNTVTVSGMVVFDVSSAASTVLRLTLPIASNFANAYEAAGSAYTPTIATEGAAILADVNNDEVLMEWIATSTSTRTMYYHYTYQIK
jgi:hypothetical protein